MPSITLTMSNGRDPVSGLSFRKLARNGSVGSADRPFPREEAVRYHPRSNGVAGPKRSSSANGGADVPSVEVLRMRLRKGKTGTKRNGIVYDGDASVLTHNNNGPVKAFPLDVAMNSPTVNVVNIGKTSSMPKPLTNLDTSNGGTHQKEPIVMNNRMPLQRLNGNKNMPRQPLPANLAQPESHRRPKNHRPHGATLPSPNLTPIKSAIHNPDATRKKGSHELAKEAVSFEPDTLPPGIEELKTACLVPGANVCFERKANLPLLISTDAAILKRRSSITQNKKNNVTLPQETHVTPRHEYIANGKKEEEKTNTMVRSRSTASEIFVQPDVRIIQACWSVILAFMGDDGSPVTRKHHSPRLLGSIVASKRKYFRSSKRMWRKSSADTDVRTKRGSPVSQSSSETGHRPRSMFNSPPSVPSSPVSKEAKRKTNTSKPHSSSPTSRTPNVFSHLTVLEKVQFLVAVGIKLPYLRDEIYCLLMKQLVRNPSTQSTALGWILLSLVMSSFAPSNKVLPFVEKFLLHQRHAWSKYCSERLARTLDNGPRANPPCSLEIKAARFREAIPLPVICADQSVRTVTVDAAMTSQEVLQAMADKNRISDPFGFCLVLQANGKVIRLGAGPFPVMDSLSQVETNIGSRFAKPAWNLYYRRDIFSPRDLFCASTDHMASWLTYSQICSGVHVGEYLCSKAADLALLAAHQYCVRHGIENVDMRRVIAHCEQCLPQAAYKEDKKSWCRMVANTLRALAKKTRGSVNPIDIMGQVIRYSMCNLTENFARTYNITTFATVGSVCTYTSDLTLCLSHERVTVRQGSSRKILNIDEASEDEVETVPVELMGIPTRCLKKVKLDVKKSRSGSTLTISVLSGGSYNLTSEHGQEIYSTLFRFIREIASGANKESHA